MYLYIYIGLVRYDDDHPNSTCHYLFSVTQPPFFRDAGETEVFNRFELATYRLAIYILSIFREYNLALLPTCIIVNSSQACKLGQWHGKTHAEGKLQQPFYCRSPSIDLVYNDESFSDLLRMSVGKLTTQNHHLKVCLDE